MTPAELYHLYRWDEPTRVSQNHISTGLVLGVPTNGSLPVIEQCLPKSLILKTLTSSEPRPTMHSPRQKRRKRR